MLLKLQERGLCCQLGQEPPATLHAGSSGHTHTPAPTEICTQGGFAGWADLTYLVLRDGPHRLHHGQGHQMLDEWDPLSQLGSQRDGDEQGGQGTPQGAQPSVRSPPWNTEVPIRKAATSPRGQSHAPCPKTDSRLRAPRVISPH